jgi:hypothetical protein
MESNQDQLNRKCLELEGIVQKGNMFEIVHFCEDLIKIARKIQVDASDSIFEDN